MVTFIASSHLELSGSSYLQFAIEQCVISVFSNFFARFFVRCVHKSFISYLLFSCIFIRVFHFFTIFEIKNARGAIGWGLGKKFESQNFFRL